MKNKPNKGRILRLVFFATSLFLPDIVLAQTDTVFNVLVFSKTADYRHASIEDGKKAILKLGERNRFAVDTTEDASVFTLRELQKYKVVVFLNNSGNMLNKKQQSAFEQYIEKGGAFVGIHGAAAAEYDWRWYGDLLGAFFDKHPKVQQATVKIKDKEHISTIALPDDWIRTDEWYNFRTNPKDQVHVLLTVDEKTYTGGTHGDCHPLSWHQSFKGARSWYTAAGHTSESYYDPYFLSHILGGIRYAAGMEEAALPSTLLCDPYRLRRMKALYEAGDESIEPAVQKLLSDAGQALRSGPWSVMDKETVPPSGDKHDYISMGPYWWPNPETENGLPYIRRDGERNPEREQFDAPKLGRMTSAVSSLSLAYYLTGEEKYAGHAARLLKTWFIDEQTRMNPHLNYGQFIPGLSPGRGIGIIETISLTRVADALAFLEGSESWTDDDRQAIVDWYDQYLTWMLESENGKDEADEKNNHGTWYDFQAVYYALFVGKPEIARQILDEFPAKRIAAQIEPDGSQPRELARTNSLGYSLMNLDGFVSVAELGKRLDVNLWDYTSADGRSIRKAIEYLLPYAMREKEWPFRQISGIKDYEKMMVLMRRAQINFLEKQYKELISQMPEADDTTNRMRLLYPVFIDD